MQLVCKLHKSLFRRVFVVSRHWHSEMNETVYKVSLENAEHFKSHTSPSGKALFFGFQQLAENCQSVGPLLNKIKQEAPKYDLDAQTPGNGYRSFLTIYDSLFNNCLTLCNSVSLERDHMLFHIYKAKYIEDLKSWNDMLAALHTFLEHLNTLLEWNQKEGTQSLFPSSKHSSQELLLKAQAIEPYSFYARHAGFQYCASMGKALRGLLTFMASYSDYFFSTSPQVWRVANSFYMGTKYSLDTEHRARRIVNVSQYATVDFCKSFWFLAESDLMKRIPNRMCPKLQVNQVISIPPEPLSVRSRMNRMVEISVPCAHGPSRPIPVRLLSAKHRPGMPGLQNPNLLVPVSDVLIIHCHGGGI